MRITFDADLLSNANVCSLKSDLHVEDDGTQSSKELSVEKSEGSYFGEWTLLGEHMGSLTAVAVDDVVCAILTKEKFDLVVGPLTKISHDDQKYVVIFSMKYLIMCCFFSFFSLFFLNFIPTTMGVSILNYICDLVIYFELNYFIY